ncbi:hypothetical protein [Nostoc phage YongM]|nr:hypothetical protein [Nostoc phage YongM]
MKIKPTDQPINFVMPDDVPEEALQEQKSVSIGEKNTSELTGVTVEEVVTPAGKEAIAFESPISGLKVVIMVPETEQLLAIERDIVRNHRDSGSLEQSMVFLSHLIVEYGDRKGVKILSFDKIKQLSRKEITVINLIASEFFRLNQI